MSLQLAAAILLALTGALAIWRSARRRGWRSATLWLQPVTAVLFYLLLFPPTTAQRSDALTVLTPGVTAEQRHALPRAQAVVALPGVEATGTIATAPDLATALRREPAVRELTVVGDGLPARDRASARGLNLSFTAAAPHGLQELQLPAKALLGAQWPLAGRSATPLQRVELRDPSGAVVDAADADREGRFRLSALARAAGPALFELRLLDGDNVTERISVPIVVERGATLSVILRAGAPDPELKYWRRWAQDAGLATDIAAGLSEGIALRTGTAPLNAATLEQTDVAIVDERAWLALAPEEKTALLAAVDDGLGLLLRVAGPLDAAVAAEWSALGYALTNLESPQGVTLDQDLRLRERWSFSAAPVTTTTSADTPLLRADDGEVLLRWRTQGRGRIGLWTLLDGYRLVLLGEPGRYGTLWAQTLGTLARARPAAPPPPQVPTDAWAGERAVLCGLAAEARLVSPEGEEIPLLRDAAGCAALWPAAGWYELHTDGAKASFYVRAADDGSSLRHARDRRETERLLRAPSGKATPPTRAVPLPRWPFFLTWLTCAAALWWLERRPTRAV